MERVEGKPARSDGLPRKQVRRYAPNVRVKMRVSASEPFACISSTAANASHCRRRYHERSVGECDE